MSKDSGTAWIPVGERLPECGVSVLIACDGAFERRYVRVDWLDYDDQGPLWFDLGCAPDEGVTHWAYLPPPPERVK